MRRLLAFASFALGCVVCACLLIATEQRAMAMYVDPGSGLLALQSAASVVAAAAFFLRKKIRAAFGFRRKPQNYSPLGEEKGDTPKAA
jgi:hypothetical protein